jgi:hypothetical protein
LKLAREFKIFPPSRAKELCDSREFTTLVAEFELNPWGEERADIQVASISRTIARVGTGQDFPQIAFMPQLAPKERAQEQTIDEMRTALQMMAGGSKRR